jgi:hypothetical protein
LHSLIEKAKPSLDLEVAIGEMKVQRARAIGMSWFQRLRTSGEREAENIGAGPNVFAELLATHLDETGHNNPWKDCVTNGKLENLQAPVTPDVYRSMKARTCDKITEAGFDCKTVGLKAMQAALP